MAVLPLTLLSGADDSEDMNAFLGYITVLALFALLAAPSFIGYVHDRRIDRELREAEGASRSSDVPAGLEVVVEGDRTLDRDLVGRRAPLEEVGQLLDTLKFHERERV